MDKIQYQKRVTNGFLLSLYLLNGLPMAFLAGIKVKELNENRASTTVKYGWLNKNPFRSIYFAVLSMAAEMSTGILLLYETQDSKPLVSMLIVKNNAAYLKKAVGKITFTCENGKLVADSIKKAKETGEGILIETKTVGKDEAGDVVAEFGFTWSVKVKLPKQ